MNKKSYLMELSLAVHNLNLLIISLCHLLHPVRTSTGIKTDIKMDINTTHLLNPLTSFIFINWCMVEIQGITKGSEHQLSDGSNQCARIKFHNTPRKRKMRNNKYLDKKASICLISCFQTSPLYLSISSKFSILR
jgi:hypothetical protein